MEFSIASYSFHRLLAAGKQDIFKYIEDCKAFGAAQLDPWNGHLSALKDEDSVLRAGHDPENAQFSAIGAEYVQKVKAAADEAGLPFGCIAVDGAHIYEPTPEQRAANRATAYRWLDVAQRLDAKQVRIDAGGPEDMPDEVFEIIIEGYRDVIARARDNDLEVLIENHWGPSKIPENVIKLLDNIDGLGLLMDTNNWAAGMQEKGWEMCAPYSRSVHIKTFEFDENGNDPTVDIPRAMNLLMDAGYNGCWGIESVPRDGDEYGGVKKTIVLMARVINERQQNRV